MSGLFDDRERYDARPADYREDGFSFLNRAAGPYWDRMRSELNSWYSAYPDDDGGLRQRFRKRSPDQHYAAWWELYLHRTFSCLGFSIEIEPPIGSASGRPDFLLSRNDSSLYLEATTVFSGIDEEGRHDAREAEVLDAINSIDNRSFRLIVEFDHVGSTTPRRVAVKTPIAQWLDRLDPDVVRGQIDAGDLPPKEAFRTDGWTLQVVAWPVDPERRRSPRERLIMGGMTSVGSVNDVDKVGAALRRKRTRYGSPDQPLVIALLSVSHFLDDDDVERILIGSRVQRGLRPEIRSEHDHDGLWSERRTAPGQRISGVLVGVNLFPHNCAQTWPRLWKNPWAANPLRLELPFPTASLDGNDVLFSDAIDEPSSVLRIPKDWPGPDAPFP